MKVIQRLEIIDVPDHFHQCTYCGTWKSRGKNEYSLWENMGDGKVCPDCKPLSKEERAALRQERFNERRTLTYSRLREALRLYNGVAVGGTRVKELVKFLLTLDPEAFVFMRYQDPDDGEVHLTFDTSEPEKENVLGESFYDIS